MERYSIEQAADLLGQLNLREQLGTWRSVEEFCGVLRFQPQFRVALQWILARLLETGCVQMRADGVTLSHSLRTTPWQADLTSLRTVGPNIDPPNSATLDLLD